MYLTNMSRWLRGAVWAAGTCVVWCPVCVCLSGGGAWWVCACAVGLITVTLGSGYTTWTVFNNFLREGPASYPLVAKCFSLIERIIEKSHGIPAGDQDTMRQSSPSHALVGTGVAHLTDTGELVIQELVITAASLHSVLVHPWYSHVSPDNHFSYQIKDVLEDILIGMSDRIKQSGNITAIASGIIQIYIQHYRQYQRTLRKISKKHKESEPVSGAGVQDLQSKYKPLHPALKSPETLRTYYRKLAQILLQHYLPDEMKRCNLILVSLRDLFAQNVLQAFVDLICDTQWLNTVLAEILSEVSDGAPGGSGGKGGQSTGQKDASQELEVVKSTQQACGGEKTQAYINPLEAIEEETPSELQQLEPISLKTDPKQSQDEVSSLKSDDGSDAKSIESEKFENAEALVQYVRSSSLEKESKEEEEYKSVSSALGTLLSTTAGPLLPDNSAVQYHPLVTKMWESPVDEKCFVDVASLKRKKNPFSRNVVEGMKEEDYKLLYYPPKGEKKSSVSVKSPSRNKDGNSCIVPKVDELSNGKIEIRLNDSDLQDQEDIRRLSDTPYLGDIPRSKSCGSLMNQELEETRHGEGKTLHASLSELDKPNEQSEKSGWQTDPSLSLSDDEMVNRKEKGHLVKMNSFDKNDGTDDLSLAINSKFDTDPESVLKNQSNKENINFLEDQNGCMPLNLPPGDVPQASSTPVDMTEADPPGTLEISPPINNAGFGWENPDLSPIYEESEDLASSIAKLRSLLTERESQHSLGSLSSYGSSESEPKSAQSDPGRYTQEKSRFTFTHKDSSGSLASVKSVSSLESCGNGIADEELLEAAEIPLDGRVFLSVSVPSTEVHTEPGGAQYTLYTIQYDAIYLCESAATPQTESGEEIAKEPLAIPEPRMVLQTNCVKRRLCESLVLKQLLMKTWRIRMISRVFEFALCIRRGLAVANGNERG